MHSPTEYQKFLQYFHTRHGFVRPPAFEEWTFNVTNGRPTIVLRTQNVATMNVVDHDPLRNAQNNAANVNRKDDKKEKAEKSRTLRSRFQMDVLVNHWKENFDELGSTTRNETWAKIASAVSILGIIKTLKNCQDKIRNFCDPWKIAKNQNEATGESFHSSLSFEAFGHRDVMVISYLKEVGVTN